MPARVAALLLLAAAFAAQARAQPDPLHSPACLHAREALDAALGEPVQDCRDHPQRVVAARQRAADACLGPMSSTPARSGAPDPPVAVPAPVIEMRRAPAAPAIVGVMPPPVVIPRSAPITACDAAGCWDTTGQRLNNMGPVLVGPRGPCVVVAGQATCP